MAELDPERIAAAALLVANKHGVAGFTMRAVAEALGVTPMALYHHVRDKAALAALVVDRASGEIPLPAPSGAWREDLWAIAHWMRRVTLAHPSVGRLRSIHDIWTPAMLHVTDRWVTLWQQSGLPANEALSAASMSSTAIGGYVERELALRQMRRPEKS